MNDNVKALKIAESSVDFKLVEYLEMLLSKAKEGRVNGVVMVTQIDGNEVGQFSSGLEETKNLLQFIGMLDVVKWTLSAGLMEDATLVE